MGWWGSILIAIQLFSLSQGWVPTAWATSSGVRYEHEEPLYRPGGAQNSLVTLLPNRMPHHAFNVSRLIVMLDRAKTTRLTLGASVPPLGLTKGGTVRANDVLARLKRLTTQEVLNFTASDYSALFDALTGEIRDARRPVFTSMAAMGPSSPDRAPASIVPTDNRSLDKIAKIASGLDYIFRAAQALREQMNANGVVIPLPSGAAIRQLLTGVAGSRVPERIQLDRLEKSVSELTVEQTTQIPMQDARDLHSEVRKVLSVY